MAVRFENLDGASSFRLLEGEPRVRLSEVLGGADAADRIASHACDYDLGEQRLAYNYAAKQVSPQILARGSRRSPTSSSSSTSTG